MAGLDTRGLAGGFAQGFGLMNQFQRGQRADERADQQMGMQQERMNMQREQFSAQQEEVERQRDMENIQFTLGKIGSGMEVGEDELKTLRKYPKFWSALDPETDNSINQAMAVIDPNTSVDANDPESLAALNQMFGAEINRGEGGQKRVVGMYPAPDGQSVALELEVVGEDGNTYRAPMTEGRGTAEDDLVKYVPVEALVEQVQGMRMLRNTLRSPEAQQRATQVLGLLRGDSQERWEQVQGPGGSILQRNTVTGETKQVLGRAPQSGGNYWDRPTATQKDIEYLLNNGLAPSREAAWQMLNRSNDSSRDELKYYTGRLEDIESILSAPGAANAMNDEELAQFQSERQAIRDMLPELESRAFGRQPAGLSIPASRQSSAAASTSTEPPPQSQRERGLQPGPKSSEPAENDLLNSILRDL
ncbi:hypothetical protein [Vreelandella venusta]|uniref:hypothetical protein n=1 Tax=Vreelandella venusta TaxID=44935 RepID=UPI0018DA6D54|nr:hypothetical protein [Halomonas venusta]QPI65948.1 hypothetical protein IR195_09725 [Halomonas venusta]